MYAMFKIFREAIAQAVSQLNANRLRSFLSLLGITIGIFCIIGVLSAVDSLEANIRGSLEKLGDDVLYVQKISWAEDPGANWFKYLRRPGVTHDDYLALKEKLRLAENVGYHVGIGTRTAKYLSNSVDRSYVLAVSAEGADMFNLKFAGGRFFSNAEYQYGSQKTILGAEVAEQLFGNIDPVGKSIKVSGRKLEVIGVLEKEGESLVNIMNFDEVVLISYPLGKKMANLKTNRIFEDAGVSIKARAGVELLDIREEIRGILRASRRVKPKEEDNFSINQLSLITSLLDNFFGVLNLLGYFIGGFSILVGMFSVANIMFVSVKERTNIIGIKKALGAKRWVILTEFLVEAIILCFLGGLIGLLSVGGIMAILSQAIDFDLNLSLSNVITGILISVIIGILAGMIPASRAASLDPVEAMRQ